MMSFRVGNFVERELDGYWFIAEVQQIEESGMTLKYLDDGNVECNVPIDQIRTCENSKEDEMYTPTRRDTLRKPLTGLVEDDSEARYNHLPTVTVHSSMDTEKAIIINGPERTLAAGGGLRALRYLKK